MCLPVRVYVQACQTWVCGCLLFLSFARVCAFARYGVSCVRARARAQRHAHVSALVFACARVYVHAYVRIGCAGACLCCLLPARVYACARYGVSCVPACAGAL
jgi:hypothetical protein